MPMEGSVVGPMPEHAFRSVNRVDVFQQSCRVSAGDGGGGVVQSAEDGWRRGIARAANAKSGEAQQQRRRSFSAVIRSNRRAVEQTGDGQAQLLQLASETLPTTARLRRGKGHDRTPSEP
jgi:hypothetical protein